MVTSQLEDTYLSVYSILVNNKYKHVNNINDIIDISCSNKEFSALEKANIKETLILCAKYGVLKLKEMLEAEIRISLEKNMQQYDKDIKEINETLSEEDSKELDYFDSKFYKELGGEG